MAFLVIILSLSCEDPIDVELETGSTLLVVDGWITDEPGPHEVILSTTSPYFDNNETPRKTGAEIIITDSEGNVEFLAERQAGVYDTSVDFHGVVGRKYYLSIQVENNSFEAETEIKRPAQIDSLNQVFKQKTMMNKEGIYVHYFGPEAEGVGDFYRFRIFRNDQLLNKPSDLIVVQDRMADGVYFKDVQLHSDPFEVSDRIIIENWSITEDAYFFYAEMRDQISNGGMFAKPVANIRTNIKSDQGNDLKAVGYFGGASVSKKKYCNSITNNNLVGTDSWNRGAAEPIRN